jgi:dTDP-4-dehydrorhamnose reductase
MRIAVTGARGQLGAAVAYECAQAHDVITFAHAELDIGSDAAVADAMARAKPDVIVNGAAFTDVDAAEDRPIEALTANAFGVRALARAARTHGAALVHFSTDFVFDGRTSVPYIEEDPPNPQSVYAASKLLGEWFALDAPRAYVLRVESLFGRTPGARAEKGSAAHIVSTLLSGGSPRVFEDRTISPTYIPDGARAVRRLIESDAPPGIYHCVNSGCCTWLELAQEFARRLGIDATLVPVRMSDMKLRASRPLFCALSNEKLRGAGVDMPQWQDAVARFVNALRSDDGFARAAASMAHDGKDGESERHG